MNIPPLVLNLENSPEKITIRLFQEEDAPAIARLFHTVYGDAYPGRTYYDPSRLIQANNEQKVISLVVCNHIGDIVGHVSLYRSAPSPLLYEIGAGVILPTYRTLNLFNPLLQYGVDYMRAMVSSISPNVNLVSLDENNQIAALFGEMVCNHLKSQKSFGATGAVETALEISLMPAEAYVPEKSASGRVSTLIGYIIFHSKPHLVYIPSIYRSAVEYLYAGINEKRQIIWEHDSSIKGQVQSIAIDVQIFPPAQSVRIAIHQAGADLATRFLDYEAQARQQCDSEQKDLQLMQVFIALNHPETGFIVSSLRKQGYFFGGILPYWFGCDALLMQKPIQPPQWENIQLLSDRARKLKDFVYQDWLAVTSQS